MRSDKGIPLDRYKRNICDTSKSHHEIPITDMPFIDKFGAFNVVFLGCPHRRNARGKWFRFTPRGNSFVLVREACIAEELKVCYADYISLIQRQKDIK